MTETKNETRSYLTFKLDEEEFAIHVSQALNILEMTNITKVPQTPEAMKGVINLRGTVLPIIDTRINLGLDEKEYTSNTCIIVTETAQDKRTLYSGLIVDEVVSVIDIEKKQIESSPELGNSENSEFIVGMAKVDERFIILLDIQKMFSAEDLSSYTKSTKGNLSVK